MQIALRTLYKINFINLGSKEAERKSRFVLYIWCKGGTYLRHDEYDTKLLKETLGSRPGPKRRGKVITETSCFNLTSLEN